MSQINFFKESVSFRMMHSEDIKKWLINVCRSEKRKIENINYIFCNDGYLRKMNKQYLQHDYNTDIITFDNSESREIAGDIFISIDRVKSNCVTYKSSFADELHRVMVHGLLHLIGYDDTTEKKKVVMRKKEDEFLSKRSFIKR